MTKKKKPAERDLPIDVQGPFSLRLVPAVRLAIASTGPAWGPPLMIDLEENYSIIFGKKQKFNKYSEVYKIVGSLPCIN